MSMWQNRQNHHRHSKMSYLNKAAVDQPTYLQKRCCFHRFTMDFINKLCKSEYIGFAFESELGVNSMI